MPRAADIAPHLKDAALLAICTPQNPTGTTLSKEELEKSATRCWKKQTPWPRKKPVLRPDVLDITYGNIQHYHPVSLRPAMKEYTICVDAISKVLRPPVFGLALKVIAKMKSIL